MKIFGISSTICLSMISMYSKQRSRWKRASSSRRHGNLEKIESCKCYSGQNRNQQIQFSKFIEFFEVIPICVNHIFICRCLVFLNSVYKTPNKLNILVRKNSFHRFVYHLGNIISNTSILIAI